MSHRLPMHTCRSSGEGNSGSDRPWEAAGGDAPWLFRGGRGVVQRGKDTGIKDKDERKGRKKDGEGRRGERRETMRTKPVPSGGSSITSRTDPTRHRAQFTARRLFHTHKGAQYWPPFGVPLLSRLYYQHRLHRMQTTLCGHKESVQINSDFLSRAIDVDPVLTNQVVIAPIASEVFLCTFTPVPAASQDVLQIWVTWNMGRGPSRRYAPCSSSNTPMRDNDYSFPASIFGWHLRMSDEN